MEEFQRIFSHQPSLVGSDQAKAQDIAPVKLGWNVCYIVCGLVIKDDQILMIQEAKPSCRGKWYMPAGRVERNESLEDAVKREVKEEAGYEFDPKALIGVEFQSFNWIRFTFIGDISGGNLKTPAEADKESIQAKWMTADVRKLKFAAPLRADDCLPLIDLAYKWHKENEANKCSQLIVSAPHSNSFINILLVRQDGDELFILLKDAPAGTHRLPSNIGTGHSPYTLIEKTIESCGYSGQHAIHGIVSVEHQVENGDGICASILVSTATSDLVNGCGYNWHKITDANTIEMINKSLKYEHSLIQLIHLWR